MRILVAGATSTLGGPVVSELTGRGHHVLALTRSASRAKAVARPGVTPLLADVHDEAVLRRAVESQQPDAVVSLLIKLPKSGPTRWGHFDETVRLWDEGVPALLHAARTAGTPRIVAESVAFAYGYGASEEVLREATAVDEELAGPQRRVLGSLRRMESAVAAAGGTALRLGAFRGPDVPTERLLLRLMRHRLPVLPGGGRALLPFVDLDDAARAVVRAVEADSPGPLYNIADDESVEFRDYARAVANAGGAPPPRSVPRAVARLTMPYSELILGRVRLRVSNALADRDLGWRPSAAPVAAAPKAGRVQGGR